MGYLGDIWKAVAHPQEDYPAVVQLDAPETVNLRIETAPPLPYKAEEKPEQVNINPLDTFNMVPPENQGNRHPGTDGKALSYDTLDMLASVPIVQAILNKRVNQWAEYATPQKSRFDVGYRMQLRDSRQKMSEAAHKRALELERWLYTCGDPRLSEHSTFETWMRKVAWDSLRLDQLCTEIVYADNGKPAGFLAVDAKTIRRAKLKPKEWDTLRREPRPGFVQVLNNKQMAVWDAEHFIFGVRNPRTGIEFNGYGHPELEQAAITITQLVNATSYNAANFTNGIHSPGVLAIKSAMSNETFKQYERQIRSMMTGAHNAGRVITAKLDPNLQEAIEWLNLANTNKEMEYGKWIDFLVKVICTVFQMDPAELGFTFATGGMLGNDNGSGQTERVATSKETGLRPNIRFVETLLNTRIIHKLDDDFELSLAGFDWELEKVKLEHYNKAVRTYLAVDEVRAENNLAGFGIDAATNGPIDGVYQAAIQNAKNFELQQQQAAMAMGGAPVEGAASGAVAEDAEPGAGDQQGAEGDQGMSEEDMAALFDSPEDLQKALALREKTLREIEV